MLFDLRLAVRHLRRAPLFSVMAVLSLAVGIGSTTAVYSIVDAVLLRPLPAVPNASPIVTLSERGQPIRIDAADFAAFRSALSEVVEGATACASPQRSLLRRDGDLRFTPVQPVDGAYFETLGLRPARGRLLSKEDDEPAAAPVAVLSAIGWRTLFDRRDDVIGQPVVLKNTSFTIVGVAPAGFRGLDLSVRAPHLFITVAAAGTIETAAVHAYDGKTSARQTRWVTFAARLKPDVDPAHAQAVLQSVWRRHVARPDGKHEPPKMEGVADAALSADRRDGFRRFVTPVGAAAASCLAIACANLAALLLARGQERRKEMALRGALGATRGRLVRQLLVEAVTLSCVAAAAGALVARWAFEALAGFSLPGFVDVESLDLRLSGGLLVTNMAIAVATGLLFGIVPAWQASRTDLLSAMTAANAQGGRRHTLAPRLFLAGQVALCLPLLLGAGLFTRSIRYALTDGMGFDTTGLLELTSQHPDRQASAAALHRLVERARAMPGVESATLVSSGITGGAVISTGRVWVDGIERRLKHRRTEIRAVGSDYFRTLRLSIVRGRSIDETDRAGTPRAAIISTTLAEDLCPGESCLGYRFSHAGPEDGLLHEPVEVVGVVDDVRFMDYANRSQKRPNERHYGARIYIALAQQPPVHYFLATALFVRSAGPATTLAAALQRELRAVDPAAPPHTARLFTDFVRERHLAHQRLGSRIVGFFGTIAMLLAAVGLYGVLAYSTAQRTTELGIRAAIGASRRDLLWLVLRDGVRVLVPGVVVGIVLSLWASRLITTFLMGVKPNDVATLAGAVSLLLTVGVLASYIPARRAAAIDPARALRSE